MSTAEINKLTRYLEELDGIQSSLLAHTYAVESASELGAVALEMPPVIWVAAVTQMQRLKDDMRSGLMLVTLKESKQKPQSDDPLEGVK